MFSIYLFHMLYDWIYFPFSSLWSYTAKRPAGLVNFYMNIYLFFRKNTNQHFGECQFKICAYMKIGTYQFASLWFFRCFESRIQTVSNLIQSYPRVSYPSKKTFVCNFRYLRPFCVKRRFQISNINERYDLVKYVVMIKVQILIHK